MALGKLLFMASGFGHGPYTFTRSSEGRYIDADGVLQVATTDALRVEYVDLSGDGVRETPTFLLEGPSTNLLTRSEDFTHADWTANNTVVDADVGGTAANTTGADLLMPTTLTNTHSVSQVVDVTASADQTLSVFASPGGYNFLTLQLVNSSGNAVGRAHFELTSSGSVVDSASIGSGTLERASIERLRPGHYRCEIVATISTSTAGDWEAFVGETSSQMATSWAGGGSSAGLGVLLWGGQQEDDQSFATSYMPSVSAAGGRAADTLYFDFPHAPQEMTVYVRFIESGTKDVASGGLVHVGSATQSADPRFVIQSDGAGLYAVRHDNGMINLVQTAASGPSQGDDVELRAVLNADGSVFLGQSLNAASETVTATTATGALQGAWADTRLYVNSRGTSSPGVVIVPVVKVAAGVKTMAEMRSLDPSMAIGGTVIPVALNTGSGTPTGIGDSARTFDGSWRETIRNRPMTWSAETPPLTVADTRTVEALLESSTQPHTSAGTLMVTSTGANPNVFTKPGGKKLVQSGQDPRYVLKFTAEQSS